MASLLPIPNLSDDLIREILKRVQVKDVIHCQTVCKPWLGIIQSQQFVMSQLRHAARDVASPQNVDDLWLPYVPDEDLVDIDYYFPCIVGASNGIVTLSVNGFNMRALGYDSLEGDYKVLRAVYPDNMVGMNSLNYEAYSDTRGIGGSLGLSAFNLNSEVLITTINLPVIDEGDNVQNDAIGINGIDDVPRP
ncbi:hypothetical protein POM88_053916 [Heracleum sosnowskyi]|uniref:F-box domain-containing protein n=1 Tax=Heracleum sosnowskyi TaxID=360622 RepID=A0AAD8GPT8_9APIA|nr:hypothetical protein POM88_053916 [Heracleum sosnowskyi]